MGEWINFSTFSLEIHSLTQSYLLQTNFLLGVASVSGEACASYSQDECKQVKEKSKQSKKYTGSSSFYRAVGVSSLANWDNADADDALVPIE